MKQFDPRNRHSISLSEDVEQKCQSLPDKSFWDFQKKLNRLKEDAYLLEEIPVAILGDCFFAFPVEGGLMASAKRKKYQRWWRRWKAKIEIVNLMTVSEFYQLPNRTTPQLTLGETQSLWKVWNAIAPLLHDAQLVSQVLIPVALAISLVAATLFAVGQPGSKVQIKNETDGDRETNEVIFENHQSE